METENIYVSRMELTLSEVVSRLADTSDDREHKAIARQVQHWTANGLLKTAGIDMDAWVGRGRARQYPEEALPWLSLMLALARYGLLLSDIIQIVMRVRLDQLKKSGSLARAALHGRRSILLVAHRMGESGDSDSPMAIMKTTLMAAPVTIDSDWHSGLVLNLTKVFALEKTKHRLVMRRVGPDGFTLA